MLFREVIGQEDVKSMLRKTVEGHRVPHALLFSGPSGCGKLAMAVAFANYLLCRHRTEDDSCGLCPPCKQLAKYSHPDLHFSFPVIKKTSSPATCEDYMAEWRSQLSSSLYFGLDDWMDRIGSDNKQAFISEAEGDRIIDRLSISSYEGGYKVMIIWLPEKMRAEAANNLLKTLEEPTDGTVFILVSNDSSAILPTILSRTQNLVFRPLPLETIADALMSRNGLDRQMALQIARISGGSYLRALQLINIGDESSVFFKCFTSLMRSAYSRNLQELKSWSDEIASWGRERQKALLAYFQNMLRENFVYNFRHSELNFMSEQEVSFSVRFARFINERNVKGFMDEFSCAQRDIEQNVNSRTVLFNLALQSIILIRR